jgi:light-regulated signal transduction histidine kinase (bacteriophytochrome)
MPGEQLKKIAQALFSLANHLSDTAYQNIQQARFIFDRKTAEVKIRSLNEDLERRVKDRTAQLEATNKEMEAFSYSVSHDLRTPLQSISGFSDVLVEEYQDRLDEKFTRYVSRIRSSAHRMGQIIEDLLKLSQSNRSAITFIDIELSDVCAHIAMELAQANPGRTVKISIQPGMVVHGDRSLMQVVVENLLGNAWKFTAKIQTPKIEVGEILSPFGERIFFIRDNGAGFDMAHADKLFSAFERLHSASDFEGTGIGLSIVDRVIFRHGGRVWAESQPGHGATFFFTIPDRFPK